MNDFDDLGTKRRSDFRIDVINLIDVLMVLIVFLVLSTNFNRDTGVKVTKPSAQSASEVQKDNILVAISREGNIFVNERQVDLVALKDLLDQMVGQNPDREVVLVADKDANTGTLVKVLDACNLAGAKKVSVAAQNEGS
jgi:biopolymer transport protein ExbD